MPVKVNLDALIRREDFAVVPEDEGTQIRSTVSIGDLKRQDFFYEALRKPDFQRETAEWEPSRVVGLIRSFLESDLIPAVILWKNRDLLFVIDGSHRLSALIAWVNNDYGDGPLSRAFFKDSIPEDQIKVAIRTRDMIKRELGSYEDHVKAAEQPENFGPHIAQRARKLGSLAISLQWVQGNASRAENSFVRINQQAAQISPQELDLLKSRRKPSAIAARAIFRRGAGHKYWSGFPTGSQDEIVSLATEIHNLLFEPELRYPLATIDLPAGGAVYTGTSLGMVYDLVKACAGPEPVDSPEQGERRSEDRDGSKTVDYLKRCRSVMRLMLSDHPSSLGLHPAVYFYSWTGKQQPILFLAMADFVIDFQRRNRLPYFIQWRNGFEEFLVAKRSLVSQVIRKYGTKRSGLVQMRRFYDSVLALVSDGGTTDETVVALIGQPGYSYLQPSEQPHDGTPGARLSKGVRSGVVMQTLLNGAPRCQICGGYVPSQAMSIDHRTRREDGGASGARNAQLTHPYCNSGIKEMQWSSQKKLDR